MFPIRRNFYNKEIFMIHEEKLVALIGKTEDILLKKQICMLIKEYEREIKYLNELPYELRSWPNSYMGLSSIDERNAPIINLALQEKLKEDLFSASVNELIFACGYAYLEGNNNVVRELDKMKKFLEPPYERNIDDILQVVSEDTLDYFLAFVQTKCKVTNDKRIVFYNGEKFMILDTTVQLESDKKFANIKE